MLEIGVVTASHPGRGQNGHMERVCRSVWEQELPARGHFIVNDVDRRGAAWTRQAALEANPFEWTAFLDSDDWFLPQHLRRLAETQVETGADYVYSWYWLAHGPEVLMETTQPFPLTHYTEPWNPAEPRQTTITVLVRTELAKEVGFWAPEDETTFPDGLRVGEDWGFTLGCNERGKIHHLVERTWVWNHHGLNTSGRPDRGDAQ